jgi:hypothetical protein
VPIRLLEPDAESAEGLHSALARRAQVLRNRARSFSDSAALAQWHENCRQIFIEKSLDSTALASQDEKAPVGSAQGRGKIMLKVAEA